MKEPALSDGRLQPGDKLLAANGVELASFSHQEVIIMIIMMMMMMMMVVVTIVMIIMMMMMMMMMVMVTIVMIIMMMMMTRDKLLAAFLSSRGDYHDGDHKVTLGGTALPDYDTF